MEGNQTVYLPFPGWTKSLTESVSYDDKLLDPELGVVENVALSQTSDSVEFIPSKMYNLLCDERKVNSRYNRGCFPIPFRTDFRLQRFRDLFWTGEDIVKKYGRELDFSGFDFCDKELYTYFHDKTCLNRSVWDFLFDSEASKFPKTWKAMEAEAVISTKDDPEYMGNCLDIGAFSSGTDVVFIIGNGCKKGRLHFSFYRITQEEEAGTRSSSSNQPNLKLTEKRRVKFKDRIVQVEYCEKEESAICRTESGIYYLPIEKVLSERWDLNSDDFACVSGKFRDFTCSAHGLSVFCLKEEGDRAVLCGNSFGSAEDIIIPDRADLKEDETNFLSCAWSDHPKVLYLLWKSGVVEFDLRTNTLGQNFFVKPENDGEYLIKVGKPLENRLFPVLTSKRVYLLDDRRKKEALQKWSHSLPGGVKLMKLSNLDKENEFKIWVSRRIFNDIIQIDAAIKEVNGHTEKSVICGLEAPFRLFNASEVVLLEFNSIVLF